jgi:Zn ribbon nucleic-acid-binding protein
VTAIQIAKCPRCTGAVIDYQSSSEDSAKCLTCGWRDQQVSQDVQREINVSLGEPKLAVSPYLGKPSRVEWWQEQVQSEYPAVYNLSAG